MGSMVLVGDGRGVDVAVGAGIKVIAFPGEGLAINIIRPPINKPNKSP
jgi:hypothetical protein